MAGEVEVIKAVEGNGTRRRNMVGIYADEAITGTKTVKRDGFLKMINDCMAGMIDVIPTKSISRFSRNLVDTLQYVRMLKEKGSIYRIPCFRTPDNTVFLADCLSSKETLDKYQISFIYDVAEYLKTLEMVKSMKAKMFVPAHAPETDDITELADLNIAKVHNIADKILSVCSEPICFENVLQRLFSEYGLTMNFEQYVLVGSTIRSYLSWLKDYGELSAFFEDNMLFWKRI